MAETIRVLFVEDVPADAEMAERVLRQEGFEVVARCVETAPAFEEALREFRPDLILSDFRMPRFDGMSALVMQQRLAPTVPFILVTGSLTEEVAVECMKAGATDYVIKDHIARLGPAVRSALAKRALAEEKLRADETLRLMTRALEAAANGILITDRSGAILWANPAVCGMTGYSVEALMGQNARLFKSGAQDADFYRRMWDTIVSGTVWRGEVVNRRPDGTLYDEDLTIAPLQASGGEVTHFVAVKQDITEKRRMQEQIAQSAKIEAVGRLAGGVAHDFNNLLGVIMGYGEMLMRERSTDALCVQRLGEILRAGQRAADLTHQLLAFSRRQIVQPKVLDLGNVVSDMDRMLRQLLGEDVDLLIVRGNDLGRVKADAGQIEQVVVNLAVNARDAMARGGRLTIETANVELDDAFARLHPPLVAGRYLRLSVADTGVGMDAATRARMFEPFFTTKPAGTGTGLGLATVYGIVKQSNGYVWVDSAPGAGATFKVYLPRVEEALTPPERPRSTGTTRGNETILLVEDEVMLRDILVELLTEFGYRVIPCANGAEALERAAQASEGIDLLLSDVVMPGMSGRELADRLTAERPLLRVLYMSGYTANAITHHGVLEGAVALIEKPFSPVVLAAKVREVLEAPPKGASA